MRDRKGLDLYGSGGGKELGGAKVHEPIIRIIMWDKMNYF